MSGWFASWIDSGTGYLWYHPLPFEKNDNAQEINSWCYRNGVGNPEWLEIDPEEIW